MTSAVPMPVRASIICFPGLWPSTFGRSIWSRRFQSRERRRESKAELTGPRIRRRDLLAGSAASLVFGQISAGSTKRRARSVVTSRRGNPSSGRTLPGIATPGFVDVIDRYAGREGYPAGQVNARDGRVLPVPARSRLIDIEQTVNSGGGAVWPLEMIREVAAVGARCHGLAMHMDGARLMNAVVASGIPAAEFAAQFDSVWIDLSKGLGCPVGGVLAGSEAFVEECWRWKHRLGGAMRQAGIVAAAGIHALDHIERLATDHRNARLLAERLRSATPRGACRIGSRGSGWPLPLKRERTRSRARPEAGRSEESVTDRTVLLIWRISNSGQEPLSTARISFQIARARPGALGPFLPFGSGARSGDRDQSGRSCEPQHFRGRGWQLCGPS